MPIKCSEPECNIIASKRKMCCGQSYCDTHSDTQYHVKVCQKPTTQSPNDSNVLIEKLDSTMLKLPGTNNAKSKPPPFKGVNNKSNVKITVAAQRAQLIISAFNKLMIWWPHIVTTTKVVGMCIFMACMTNLSFESIILYGFVKAPLMFPKGDSYGNKHTTSKVFSGSDPLRKSLVTWWYHPVVATAVFVVNLAFVLHNPSTNRVTMLAASQHSIISLREWLIIYSTKASRRGLATLGMGGVGGTNLIVNQGVDMVKQSVSKKVSTYSGMCIDIICCFVAPAIVCNISHLQLPTIMGVICATALY